MSSKSNFIQKAKSKLCIKPFNFCGKAEYSINDSTLLHSTNIKFEKNFTLNENNNDSLKTTIIASSLDNDRNLSQANDTTNISKFPFLICSPEQCRHRPDSFSMVKKSPMKIDLSNESFKENFTQLWVESFGFNTNDFQSVSSNFFQQSIQEDKMIMEPEILSLEPIFV